MSDYIKREDAIEAAKALVDVDGSGILTPEQGDKDAEDFINDVPSADVVEVVRCKDCEYWNKDEDVLNGGICDEWSDFEDGLIRYTGGDGYCSLGERKENEIDS